MLDLHHAGGLHSGGPSQLGAGGEGPQYVTNEFGDVLGTQPRGSGYPQGGSRGVPHSHINPSHTGTTTRGGKPSPTFACCLCSHCAQGPPTQALQPEATGFQTFLSALQVAVPAVLSLYAGAAMHTCAPLSITCKATVSLAHLSILVTASVSPSF